MLERLQYAVNEGLFVTLLGMGTVFAVLIILWGILELMKKGFGSISSDDKKKIETKQIQPQENKQEKVQNITDNSLIAVITAAICSLTGKSPNGFIVRSIKRTTKWK